MTEYLRVERTGPSIREALKQASPAELPRFEAEFKQAIKEVEQDFDLNHAHEVIGRWWGIAHLRLNPIPAAEREAADRAATGSLSGTFTREDGQWAQRT